jgi:hypothetical protein
VTRDTEEGGYKFEASLGKIRDPISKAKYKERGLGHGPSSRASFLAYTKPWVQSPVPPKKV